MSVQIGKLFLYPLLCIESEASTKFIEYQCYKSESLEEEEKPRVRSQTFYHNLKETEQEMKGSYFVYETSTQK